MTLPNVLPLESICNPRDLGGYRGLDGRRLKKGCLIRTGKISNITPKDAHFLVDQLHLTQIIDLRTASEREKWPDPVLDHVQEKKISISSNDGAHTSPDVVRLRDFYDSDQYAGFKNMCLAYRDMVVRPHSQQAFHDFLTQVAQNPSGATLYHCSEGKDRTGMCTFFLLYLLGVDDGTIRADYLYSNFMLTGHRQKLDDKLKRDGRNTTLRASMRSLASVANEYLDTALLHIEKDYGGLEAYLKNQLKVDDELRKTLQEKYLEPAK